MHNNGDQGRAQLEKLALAPWASRRRQELLELLDRMDTTIEELTAAVEREARKRPEEEKATLAEIGRKEAAWLNGKNGKNGKNHGKSRKNS